MFLSVQGRNNWNFVYHSQTKHTAVKRQASDEPAVNRHEVEYDLDYALREDLSDDGHGDDNECGCIHVPPIPDSPEQQRSKV